MSRPRPPYLHRVVNRHKKIVWYVWRRPGPKIRIRGEYGSKEFMAAYRAALYGEQAPETPASSPDSLSGLISRYRKSPTWRETLSEATRRQRGNIFDRIERIEGRTPVSEITSLMIKATRDKLGPGAAKHFVQTMRGLFKWAMEMELVDHDPTEGVKVARPQTDGFHPWSPEEIAAYEKRWPLGTRQRLWLAILLTTGLRRGDAVMLATSHIRDETIHLQTGKTGVHVILPLLPELRHALDAINPSWPLLEGPLIKTELGKPMTKESFGNLFREACKAAGVPGAAHGLRKAAATRLAEAGATVNELNAWFGWDGNKMASVYTRAADRARMSQSAGEKLKRR